MESIDDYIFSRNIYELCAKIKTHRKRWNQFYPREYIVDLFNQYICDMIMSGELVFTQVRTEWLAKNMNSLMDDIMK